MKQSHKLAVTIIYVISLTAALAEPQSSDLYSQAKDAYENGDCISSIELFTKYKAENESKLKNQVEFLQQINDAINDCKKNRRGGSCGGSLCLMIEVLRANDCPSSVMIYSGKCQNIT